MERNRMSSVARGGHPSGLRGTAEKNRSGAESGADGAPNAASLGAVRRGGAAGHELPAVDKGRGAGAITGALRALPADAGPPVSGRGGWLPGQQ